MFGKTHRQKKRDGDFSINDAGIGLKLYLKKFSTTSPVLSILWKL